MGPRRSFVRPLSLGVALFASGCAFFSGNPPLPKGGIIETAATPRAPDEFTEVVGRADVLYVPNDRVAWVLRRESGWKLIEALRKNGAFAIGWDAIAADEQSLLDEARNDRAAEERDPRIAFEGAASDRQHWRELLRETRASAVTQLALRCPRALAEKLRRGSALEASERAILPTGYRSPARPELASLDGVAVVCSQFIAEKIVQQLRSRPGEKLLVFLNRQELETEGGTPFFVAQKSKARQLVLESEQAPQTRARLLTRNENGIATRLSEIEDRAPRSIRNDL